MGIGRYNSEGYKDLVPQMAIAEIEKAERKELHKKFLENFRAGFRQQLEDTVIIDKNGKEVTSEKAKKAQREKGLRKD